MMKAKSPGKAKLEAARIEKVVDFETLLTTGRDMLYLRDIGSVPGLRAAGDLRNSDLSERAAASRRVMSLLTNQYQGKVVRYINLGVDSQRRIIAANLEVVNPPPANPEAALGEEEDDDPFFKS